MQKKKLPPMALEKIAVLYSQGRSQKSIAEELNVSPATVVRFVKQAKGDGLLAQAPALYMDEDRRKKIEEELTGRSELIKKLQAISGRFLHDIRVYKVDSEEVVESLADKAATYIIESVLPEKSLIGVSWGRMILAISKSMIQQVGKIHSNKYSSQLEFVQTCGDPQSVIENPKQSSHHHVAELNRKFSTRDYSRYVFSLGASIPLSFADTEIPTIRRYMESVGGYAKIFNYDKRKQKQKLGLELDALITSCGDGTAENDSWVRDCSAITGYEAAKIEKLVIGNIGGIWIAESGLNKKQQEIINRINKRWVGMTLDDVSKISKNASTGGGVVLIATEVHKAAIVKYLVKNRLVSQLIISDALADELESIL